MKNEVHILAAKRSAIGRFGGGLAKVTAADLVTELTEAILPAELRAQVGEVILGQVLQAGCGMNVARQLVLKLGLPLEVPGWTVNMACGSSLKAVALGAESIQLGRAELVIAGGVEVMSRAPHYATDTRWGHKLGHAKLLDSLLVDGLSDPVLGIGMGETAERIADKLSISRADQDAFALRSQQLATADFSSELVEVSDLAADEHPRRDTTLESLSKLKPTFRPDGSVTAGNASGINDGAAVVLLGSDALRQSSGLTSMGKVVGSAVVGCEPGLMGLGPVAAIKRLCHTIDWDLHQVPVFEINEAFAVQALGCIRELEIDADRVNPRGGAIALGHPIGASGARVLVTLLHEMEASSHSRGIASLCIGGGMGIALAVER